MARTNAAVVETEASPALAQLIGQAETTLANHAPNAASGSLARAEHHWLAPKLFIDLAAGETVTIEFGANDRDGLTLAKRAAQQGGVLGFPVFLNDRDRLHPLLSLEISLSQQMQGFACKARSPVRLNVELLRSLGFIDTDMRRLAGGLGANGLPGAPAARLLADRAGLPDDWSQAADTAATSAEPLPPERPVWLARACLLPHAAILPDAATMKTLATLRAGEAGRQASGTALAALLPGPVAAPAARPPCFGKCRPSCPARPPPCSGRWHCP